MSIKFFQAKVYFDVGPCAVDDTLVNEAFFMTREKAEAWADQEVKEFNEDMPPPDPPCMMCLDDQSPTYHYSTVQEVEIRD